MIALTSSIDINSFAPLHCKVWKHFEEEWSFKRDFNCGPGTFGLTNILSIRNCNLKNLSP